MIPLATTPLLEIFYYPLRPLYTSLYFLLVTISSLLLTLNFQVLLSPTRLRDAWFSRFWHYWGPISQNFDALYLAPLFAAHAHGTVLDLGPAHGLHLRLFPRPPQTTRILGVEPNSACHAELRTAIKANNLDGVYEILGLGAEELANVVEEGSVDCVIAVKVLCSVPRVREVVAAELYKILKPGGKMVVYEHVVNENYEVVRLWQSCLQVVWPWVLGGCNVNCDTKRWLEEAGDWRKVEWMPIEGAQKWDAVPLLMGFLTKA